MTSATCPPWTYSFIANMYSLFLTVLATTSTALAQQSFTEQDSRRPSNNDFSYMNITFSDRGAADCGTLEDNGFDLYIQSIPTSLVCFGLYGSSNFIPGNNASDTAGLDGFEGTEGYQAPQEPCPDGRDDCGVMYSISRLRDFNSTASYTQVLYSQNGTENEVGELRFRTYNGANCDFNDDDPNPSIHSWNCAGEESECLDTAAQYVIASFSVEPVTEEQRNDGACQVAVYGSGADGGRLMAGKNLMYALGSFVLTWAAIAMVV